MAVLVTTTRAAVLTDRSTTDAVAWWRLWGMVAFAHVVSNTRGDELTARGLVNGLTGAVAIAVVARPADRRLQLLLPTAIVVSAFTEAPLVGNHWWLAAAVSVAALVARPWRSVDGWWSHFAPTGRLVLIAFYSFAAFAKLNSGFFDPVESCARFFTNQSADFWGLPQVGGGSAVARVLPFAVAAIELSVPVLLLLRPTRRFGVWLGIAFHLVLSLDLRQHFFDFTLTLIPLFLLFAPQGTLTRIDQRLPKMTWVGQISLALLAAYMIFARAAPLSRGHQGLSVDLSWVFWLVIVAWIAGTVLATRLLFPETEPEPLSMRPASVGAAVVVGVVLVNALSPYLELKSATGFNMYANLVTAGGETNHYLVPGTAQWRSGQTDVVRITSSNDFGLNLYVDSGFDLPVVNLRDYLAEHPDVAVTFEHEGVTVVLDPASAHPEWIDAQPVLVEKLAYFRAVPIERPPICQPAWLPAH